MISKRHLTEGNLAAIALAAIASASIYIYSQWSLNYERRVEEQRREAALPDQWFVVRNLAVPDFIQGSDPLITYSREVRGPFIGQWVVEVHAVSASSDSPICTGSGKDFYSANDTLPDAGVYLSWFMGKDCKLPPGKYIIDALWRIEPLGYPQKELHFVSNPFAVRPIGAQLYVTPDQVSKLASEPQVNQ